MRILLTALALLLPASAMAQCAGDSYWRQLVDEANARFVATAGKYELLEKQYHALQDEVAKVKEKAPKK